MKQKDILLIGVIGFISLIVSVIVSQNVFSSPGKRQEEVEIVQPITADFPKPDTRYFNSNSFDPTQAITIGTEIKTDATSKQ